MNRSWIGCMAVVVAVGSMVVQFGPCALAAGSSVSEAKATGLVSLDIRDVDIRSAVQALFKTAGKNYAIDPNVTGTVTAISIRDAAFDVALKSLAKANALAWRVENDVYIISKKAEAAPSAPPSSVPYSDPDMEVDVVASDEIIIDKVPLNYSSASEILAAMNGDTSRLYGGLNGNTGFGMGMYGNNGNNFNNGGYGGYGGFGIGNVNIGGYGGYGGGYGGYGGYGGGNYGGFGGYGGGYGGGAYQNPIRHR